MSKLEGVELVDNRVEWELEEDEIKILEEIADTGIDFDEMLRNFQVENYIPESSFLSMLQRELESAKWLEIDQDIESFEDLSNFVDVLSMIPEELKWELTLSNNEDGELVYEYNGATKSYSEIEESYH